MRQYQKALIHGTVQAFQSGKKCVIVTAPTGFGKSYVNAAFTSVTRSFYVTPQLALIDQLLADPNLRGRFVEIKGRQNYRCYYSPQRGVHLGKCETEDYPCRERFDVCPYWMQKQLALQAPSVLMSLAYMIFEGTTEGSETYLGKRGLLVLDESHNLEEQCLNHVSLKFTPFSVPYEIYHKFLPSLKNVDGRVEMEVLLADVAGYLKLILGRLETKTEQNGLSIVEAENKKVIERFLENYQLYMFSKSEWVWEIRNDQLLLQPVFAREFMKDLVWKRGEFYLISSATILDPQEYIKLNGLTDFLKEDEIEILEAPSTFPVENRPIIDSTVGLLSKQQWDHNMPLAVAAIEEILRKETGNVAIHCHSYRHQRALVANLSRNLRSRLIVHTGKDREEKLQEWMRSRGKVFASVAFNEGQDWKYDICEAQILLKVPFADIGDKRVKRRLELGHRQWYVNQAMLEVIQAYGRAIRAEDDTARFYVVDGSFVSLVKDTWPFIPEWFKAALPSTFKQGFEG
jgi:Rad3-related DNA helicase